MKYCSRALSPSPPGCSSHSGSCCSKSSRRKAFPRPPHPSPRQQAHQPRCTRKQTPTTAPNACARARPYMSVRAQEPVSEPQPLTLKRRQQDIAVISVLEEGCRRAGSYTPRLKNDLSPGAAQFSAVSQAPPPKGHYGACARVHQRGLEAGCGCGKVRKLHLRAVWAAFRRLGAENPAPGTLEPARGISHSLPPGSRLSKRRLLRVARAALGTPPMWPRSSTHPCVARKLPGPALTTFVSRSSAGSQPRSRGPQQSRRQARGSDSGR